MGKLRVALALLLAMPLAFAALAGGCATVGAVPDASVGPMPSDGPVGKTMSANAEKFERCGRDAVTVQTGSVQNIQLRFTVEADGSVQKPQIERMDFPDPDLYSCVLRVLKKLQFPKPKDGKSKVVKYPLVIRPE